MASRAARAGMRVLGRLAAGRHGEHLFVVARRGSGSFRWGFPAGLFDRGHLGFWIAPRDGRVVVGETTFLISTTVGARRRWAPQAAPCAVAGSATPIW